MVTVVVIGAGFAGLSAVLELRKQKGVEILLFDTRTRFEYTPALHECIGNSKKLDSISFDLAKYYHEYINEEVVEITPQTIETTKHVYEYDYCIVATGSTTNYYGNASFETNALPFKSIKDVERLNVALPDAESVCVVGGGYTGVEIATMLARHTQVSIVHSGPALLHTMNKRVQNAVMNYCQKKGITSYVNARANAMEKKFVTLDNGDTVKSDLIIMASGIRSNVDVVNDDSTVNEELRSPKYANVFLCGDAARSDLLPTAHNAMVEGRAVAKHVGNIITGIKKPLKKTSFFHGLVVALGPHYGVFSGIITVSGPFAGFLKKCVMWRIMFEFKHGIQLPL